MNSAVCKRLLLVLLLIAGVSLAGALLAVSLSSNIDFFYTPRDVVHGKNGVIAHAGQRIQLGGMVKPGSIKRNETSLEVTFDVFDKDATMHVVYDGVLPDLFEEGQSVVAKGVLQENHTLIADTILAKHDENYMPPEVENAMKENHMHPPSPDGLNQLMPSERGH